VSGSKASDSAPAALRERVKELTCLYGIAQIAARPGASLEEVLQGVVELLPPAWQYSDIAAARIVLEGVHYRTAAFCEGVQKQTADIIVDNVRRGIVEIVYLEEKPPADEGPFFKRREV